MSRQNMRVSPSHKHFHIYQNFQGGLNTVDVDEKIADVELTNLLNVDIGERGSLKRRSGFVEHLPQVGINAQGMFRYFKEGSMYDEIVAVNGKLYKDSVEIPIEGLDQFQTERPIEAVQFRDKLYIATGTKLVEYNGEVAKVVDPYKPEPLEALYIGTNALADNPSDFMRDGNFTHLRVDGVTFNQRYGIVNTPITLNVFISKPQEMQVEYKFEMRTPAMREGFWEQLRDYGPTNSHTFETEIEGDLQFRIWVRPVGKDDFHARQYLIPKYKVKPVPDPNDKDVPTDTVHSCNRIILHWNRLIMYGDVNQPDAIFISHLNNPNYFPVPNSLVFESEQRDRITSIVRFRDMLVVFTPTSIQALYGKGPMDYHRLMLNSSIGCIAPYSTAIIGNYIGFLSHEGVQILKSIGYNETRMNVEKIDTKINNIIPKDVHACAIIHNDQYHLVSSDERFRFYYERGVWTKDKSDGLDFVRMYLWNGEFFGLRKNGQVVRYDEHTYDDVGFVYQCLITTKYYHFDEPYHRKKLKEIQLIMGSQSQRTTIRVNIYADAAKILGGDTSRTSVDEEGNVTWVYEDQPQFEIKGGTTFGSWELGNSPFGEIPSELYKTNLSGRCRHVKVEIIQEDNTPIQLLGLGLKFKTKRP